VTLADVSATSWLDLLLRDASADEIEAYRAQRLSEHDDGATVEAEARRALQLSALLRDRGQRVAELAALSRIAARLTSVRDLSELLTDIAVQARQLLRTDVAYLALVEGEGMTIRYMDGAVGPSFADIQLSLTQGLAGLVVQTGRPAWTSDYLGDPTIQHVEQADRLAGDEQLRSILGVPLTARGEILGVLFAAERSTRPFTESETSLLSGLANHAAVALESARLLVAERRAADELRSSAGAVDRAIALHERLLGAAVRGGGPAAVVQALSDVLEAPVQLFDASDVLLAGPDLPVPAASQSFPSGDLRTVRRDELVLCPVVAAEDYLGCLVLHGGVDGAQVRLLERGALGIALSLVQARAVADAATRSAGDVLAALVEGGEPEELERRAAAVRVDLRKPHVLALVEPHEAGVRAVANDVATRHRGLVVERGSRLLVLVPAGTSLAALTPLATVGLSAAVVGAVAMPEALAAARRCLQALLALGRRNVVGGAEDLGVYRFLLAAGGADEAAHLIRRTVGPLLDHDESRGTELARTLEEYLANGRQHGATAERLHIHPNTLYQRLSRIGVVLGSGWREPDAVLELHLALRLHRLAATLDGTATGQEPVLRPAVEA
jgi:GAF domain-containing protein